MLSLSLPALTLAALGLSLRPLHPRLPPPQLCVSACTAAVAESEDESSQLTRLGIVIVTSAARSNPNTEIIWSTIESLALFEGLSDAPILVVCDGCRSSSDLEPDHAARLADRLAADPCLFSKRGIVADSVALAYEAFKDQLEAEAAAQGPIASRLSLLRLGSHHGFALAVREGLLWCRRSRLELALVVQAGSARPLT